MKRFFPALFVALSFTVLLTAQMLFNGSESSAGKIENQKEKFSSYEMSFQKLKLSTTKGTTLQLKDVKQPIVILNFWASWCQPCLSEFSTLKKLIKKFPNDKLLVIGINNDDENPARAVKKVEKDLKLTFESVIDKDNTITSAFFISRIPGSIIFHKGKVIQYTNEEFNFTDTKFVRMIDRLLKQKI